MRKVELNMKEDFKYVTIKKLVEIKGNKKRAYKNLNCSVRHVDRMIAGYLKRKNTFFMVIEEENQSMFYFPKILKIQLSIYIILNIDCTFIPFRSATTIRENINISADEVRVLLTNEYIIS